MFRRFLKGCVFIVLTVSIWSAAHGQSDDVLSQAGFGAAVAMTGGDILIGEPLSQGVSGRVYVYRRNDSTGQWMEVQVLEPTNAVAGNGFGSAIAVDQGLSAIIAHEEDGESIFVFRRNEEGRWLEEALLKPAFGLEYDFFDESVAVVDGRIVAGVSTDDGGFRIVGFSQSNGLWVETGSIELPTDTTMHVPRPIAGIAKRLFVGAAGETDGGTFAVRTDDAAWSLGQVLKDGSDESNEVSMFGASLAILESGLAVGAPDANAGRGAVYLYQFDESSQLQQSQMVKAFEDMSTVLFGSVLSSSGDMLVVGAYDDEYDTGVAYVFKANEDGRFVPSQVIRGATIEEDAEFATAIAAGDGALVIGSMADLFGYGSAFVYEPSGADGEWTPAQQLRPNLVYRQQAIEGGRVRCEDGKAGPFDCSGVDVLSFLPNEALGNDWGILMNDVWGWTDPETGKEYAIVCTFDGAVFVDASDPASPIILGRLPAPSGTRPNWWRDAKTYGNYAYIVADNVGEHGLQIFDLTQLRSVENPPVTFEMTAHYDGFDSAHNIIINEETGFAYVVGINGGGNTCGGGSHILDLSNPVDPQFVGCFAHEGTGEEQQGYTHDAQCVVYHGPDERYKGKEICVAANETAISIADFTDKENVKPIAVGRYPNVSYAHQGWFTEDHRFFLQNDETDEINGMTAGTRTLVWDLAELDDPVLVDEHVSPNQATDHNLFIKGSLMYQSNYLSGLRVLDVSNPVQIQEVGYFDTVPWGDDRPGYGGSWSNYPFFKSGTIVVTSGEEGVFFLRRSEVTP